MPVAFQEVLWIIATIALVAVDGLFVTAEFALVRGRVARLDEPIVGPVQDEFDDERPTIVGCCVVDGGTPLATVNHVTGLATASNEVDTLGGLVMQRPDRVARAGDIVELDGAVADVIEVRLAREPDPRDDRGVRRASGGRR